MLWWRPFTLGFSLLVISLCFAAAPAGAEDSGEMPAEPVQSSDLAVSDEYEDDPQPAAASDKPSSKIEVIRITANRRSEDLQKAAISVTALGGSFIQDVGLTDFREIQKYTPNLQIIPQGDSRSTSIRIRGIGSVGNNAGIDPSVGVFIDGVYQGRAGMSVGDLIDIESVEVLRGPQGTLYGKNTAAGALKVTSRPPSYEPSAMFELVGGSYSNFERRFTLNVPLVDEVLATRLTGYGVTRDGFETNIAPIHSGENINDTGRWGLRSSTLWDVTDDLSFLVRGDYAEVEEDCCTAEIWRYGRPQDSALTSAEEFAALHDPPVELQPAIAGDRDVSVNLIPMNKVTVGGVSVEATYDLLDHTFTSLTAYRNYTSDSRFDGDFSEMDGIVSDTQVGLHQVSTELRVVSPSFDYFDYVGGLYFFYSDMQTDDFLQFTENYVQLTFLQPESSENNGDNSHKTTSVAGYVDGDLRVSEFWGLPGLLTLSGGLRVGWEEKQHVASQISTGFFANFCAVLADLFPGVPCIIPENPLYGPDSFTDQSVDDTYVTGRIILKSEPDLGWDPLEMMVYASFATGYKSAGFNQLRTTGSAVDPESLVFGPEESQSAELGIRTSWFDRMITFNFTGYYTDYQDFQAQVFDSLGIRVLNAAQFESYGFEADLTVLPLPGWLTMVTAGYNKTRHLDYKSGPCTQQATAAAALDPDVEGCEQDLTGRGLDNAPLWDISIFSAYENSLPGVEVNWFLNADYNYQSGKFLSGSLDPFLKVPGIHILGFRGGFRSQDGRWEVNAFVKNVTDENFWAIGFDVPTMGGYAAFQTPPRVFGGTFRLNLF